MDRIYWDSSALLGYLKGEDDKVAACSEVVKRAREGHFQIWSSSIAYIEVLHLGTKNGVDIPKRDRSLIRKFFDEEFVQIVAADRNICEAAQDLYWDDPQIGWKDATHLATAYQHGIRIIHAYDPDILGFNGKNGVSITVPQIPPVGLFATKETIFDDPDS